MSNKTWDEAQQQSEAALKLLTTDEADGIIGEPQPDEYGVLIRGMKGTYQMLWAVAVRNGLRPTKQTQRMGSQLLMVMVTIVHYAYAAGIRRGRGEPGAVATHDGQE